MEPVETDFHRAQNLQDLLINHATGGIADEEEYQRLRHHFITSHSLIQLVPEFIKINRDLSQFWQYIKSKYPTYAERREFIWTEFVPLLDMLEMDSRIPSDQLISDVLKRFNPDEVQIIWLKALDRRQSDPEGAITIAKTLLETVCKHILDEKGIDYSTRLDLPHLYHLVSMELSLSPSQHSEEIFKQILGNCSGVINGLSLLRNRLGDAHGQGRKPTRPHARHAGLAINLAGSIALFLVETWESAKKNRK